MSNSSIYEGDRFAAATSTDHLETRLRINAAYASTDLTEWLFERLEVGPGMDVLDVGCGNGAQTLPLVDRVGADGSVSALDISESSVDALKAALPPGAPVEAVAADMAELDSVIEERFRVKAYDLTHSSYALYYSADRAAVLDVMRKRLKPGGRCAVFTPNEPHGLVDFAARFHPVPEEIYACFRFGPEVLQPYFDAHFETVTVHHFNNRLTLPDADTLMTFYEATTYYDPAHADAVRAEAERIVAERGAFEYQKNGFLIIGQVAG